MWAVIIGIPIRKVARLGHPLLRAPARLLSAAELAAPEVQRLVDELAATMAAYEGVGLAANQVGEGVSLFVMGLPPDGPRHPEGIALTAVFNPRVRLLGSETATDWEGCLSVPGLRGKVERHVAVELAGLDREGKPFARVYEGFPARVVQHETDHLAGKIYLDRMRGLESLSYAGGQ
jgi:peptide deformylase